jgi:DNA polymerase III epsilon subunit family exonuclease
MNALFDPHQPLNETTFAIFDVETTGLSPTYGHRVCEVACLRARDGVTLDRFESLIDPRRPISPGAFRVNRITPEMLHGAPTFAGVAAPLLRVMDGTVWVAHNAPFDLGFLAAELEIARLPLPENPVIDTLTLARRIFGFARNSLSAVAAALGLENSPTHRAMGDVQTTLGVLEQLLWDLERRWGITTLNQLIAFQGGSIPYPNVHALPLPPTIAEALGSNGRVRMRYVDARGWETDRVVRPLRVSEERGNLYLVAHCYRRDALRTFRLDRVVEMVLED